MVLIGGIAEAAQSLPSKRARNRPGPRHSKRHVVQLDGSGEALPYHVGLGEHHAASREVERDWTHTREKPNKQPGAGGGGGRNAAEWNQTAGLVTILPTSPAEASQGHLAQGAHEYWKIAPLGFPSRGSTSEPASHAFMAMIWVFGVAYAMLFLIPSCSQLLTPGGQALLDSRLPTAAPTQPAPQERRQEDGGQRWFDRSSSCTLYATFCAHGIYSGVLGTTWLPYLVPMECELLWPSHVLLLMGIAGCVFAVASLCGPALCAIVDLALRHAGQAGCRAMLRVGVIMSAISIVACCFAAGRAQTKLFLSAILFWTLGDLLVKNTLEIFCCKSLGVRKCQELYELRLSSVLVGGLLGCLLIIFSVCLHHYWLYFAYLSGLLITGFCVLHALKADRTVEICTAAKGGAHNKAYSWTRDLVQAYASPFRLRSGFPRICFAYLLFGLACTPMLCMLLFVKDLATAGRGDDQTVKAIFGLSMLFSVLNGFGSTPGGAYGFVHFTWVDALHHNADLGTTQLMGFSALLLLLPILGSFGDDVVSQLMCYALSACLGAAYGAIHRTFLECLPRVIPGEAAGISKVDSVQVLVFFDMCKRVGTGLGLALISCIVTYAVDSSEGVAVKMGDSVIIDGQRYSRAAYIVLCTFCSPFAVMSALCMLSVPAVMEAEQRALQSADECFETMAPAPTGGHAVPDPPGDV